MSEFRAFARCGAVRFLASADDPHRVFAQEQCTPPHESRHFWHSAGVVSMSDLRTAAKHGLACVWVGPTRCWRGSAHRFDGGKDFVRALMVALDAALERGMPVMRVLPEIDNPSRAQGTAAA